MSNVVNLSPLTTYYLKSYATNSIGTAYGNEFTFTTPAILPTVVTGDISNILSTSATVGGNITSDGGAMVTHRGVCWSTSPNPTLANNVAVDGVGKGTFTGKLENLQPAITYYVRAFATNIVGTAYGNEKTVTTMDACEGASTVKDYNGNTYNTIAFGRQCWMKQNLRATAYSDGTTISLSTSTTNSTTKYRYYPDNLSSNVSGYGYLYNWPAVMNDAESSSANPSGVQGPCPVGWHVPSDAEWTELTDYISLQSQYGCGTATYICKALASTETEWTYSSTTCNTGNTLSPNNASGFNARPTGRFINTGAVDFGGNAGFWTATASSANSIYRRDINYNYSYFVRGTNSAYVGRGVRCVKNPDFHDTQSCPGTPTVTDNDNHIYNTVQIGKQCWMKQNLRTTKYPDGTPIPLGATTSTTTGFYYHVNGDSTNDASYGLLYNWVSAMDSTASSNAVPSGVRGICPENWHLPSYNEFQQLKEYISGQSYFYCGGDNSYIAKSLASTTGWSSTSTQTCSVGNTSAANNATVFTATQAGIYNGNYYDFGETEYFWTATGYNSGNAWSFYIYYTNATVPIYTYTKARGQSVRCVKD